MTNTIIQPSVSVVTVTLNNLEGLKKTYQSLEQLLGHEWIVIDGGSTDGTLEFLETTNALYISEPDNGIYDAMNKGIARATGEYINFMNAGDCFENVTFLYEIAGDSYDFIHGDALEHINGRQLYKKARPHQKITQGMFTHHQAMIYNRKILGNIIYDTSYEIAADYDLTWRYLHKADPSKFLTMTEPICLFESGGISQQKILQGRIEQFKIRERHGVSFFKNGFVFTAQTLVYILRKILPKFYWFLKRG